MFDLVYYSNGGFTFDLAEASPADRHWWMEHLARVRQEEYRLQQDSVARARRNR